MEVNERVGAFEIGQVAMTQGVLKVLSTTGVTPGFLLARHMAGDWGDLDEEDRIMNNEALINNERILSAYKLATGDKIWIITERDRSVTTLLLPSEY